VVLKKAGADSVQEGKSEGLTSEGEEQETEKTARGNRADGVARGEEVERGEEGKR
jgi:hypothetical protein